jgi:putative endonuclease
VKKHWQQQWRAWFRRSVVRPATKTVDDFRIRWTQWRLSKPWPARQSDESVGAYGERLAAEYLRRKGYFLLERSYRLKSGEIDLVAVWRKKVVVFVEVKTWSKQLENTGGPSDAVDPDKQAKISHLAMMYMKRHRLMETTPGRADVIEVVLAGPTGGPAFRHFENAFEAVGKFQFYR